MSKLPDSVTVLVVQRDDTATAGAAGAQARSSGRATRSTGSRPSDAARAALDEHPHDAFLVDCDTGGLELAREILAHTPHAPVLLLDDDADRETDLAAAEARRRRVRHRPRDRSSARCGTRSPTSTRSRRLAESEQRHALAMQGANDGLWDWDVRARPPVLLPALEADARLRRARAGRRARRVARPRPSPTTAPRSPRRSKPTCPAPATTSSTSTGSSTATAPTAGCSPAAWRSATRTAAPLRVVGSQTDVTDRKQAEQRLQHDALHDALTGLPNRVLFLDRLDQAIRRAQRAQPGAPRPPSCSSTSTASSSSTTRSATRSATSC